MTMPSFNQVDQFLQSVFSCAKPAADFLHRQGVPFNLAFYAVLALPFAIWLGCAFWAARTAGREHRSRIVSFIAGLAIPVVYAVLLPSVLRRQRRQKREQAKAEDEARRGRRIQLDRETRRRPVGETGKVSVAESAPENQPQDNDFLPARETSGQSIEADNGDRQRHYDFFMQKLKEQKAGGLVRLRIQYSDNEVVAERILEVMPELVVVETIDFSREHRRQSLRVPLARLVKVEEVS